jgi:hypothetical protein
MSHVSFKIGDNVKRDMKGVSTIYKQTIGSKPTDAPQQRSATNLALKNSNINFGTEPKVAYVSEAKEKYVPQAATAGQAPMDHAKLRSSHFTL